VLFRVNMYRKGREKRLEARRRVRRAAMVAAVVSLNVIFAGLFVSALLLSDRAIAAREVRLTATKEALAEYMAERGSNMTPEEMGLARLRAEQVRWSAVLTILSRVAPKDMWLPYIRLTDSFEQGSPIKVPGLRLTGRLKAKGEEEGLNAVMAFIAALSADSYFSRCFNEPRLVESTWLTESGSHALEFDVFCALKGPEALADSPGGAPASGVTGITMQDGSGAFVEARGDDDVAS
jgi:Tfp pilus assembly protein PilN